MRSLAVCLAPLALFPSCNTPWEWAAPVAGTVVAGTIVGARSPSTELEQVYYLGVFDPLEQLPPTIYRVRVRGQASAISQTKFASGWVKAGLIDSLGSSVGYGQNDDGTLGGLQATNTTGVGDASLTTGRRLVMFGPEGFREAPRDHRLCIVMGSSPNRFFQAIDEALGQVAAAELERLDAGTQVRLLRTMQSWLAQEQRLDDLLEDVRDARREVSGS